MDIIQANELLYEASEPYIGNKNRYIFMDDKGNVNIVLSVSLINKMFSYNNEMDFCPRYLYEVVMCRNVVEPPSLPMQKGLFFETLAIGGTAYGTLYDLPRKAVSLKLKQEAIIKGLDPESIKGDKTIDQIRIEEQAALFPSKCRQYGISIFKDGEAKNVQVSVSKQWTSPDYMPDTNIFLEGTIDIYSGLTYEGQRFPEAVIDLKLTKDINGQGELPEKNKWSRFNFGDPANLDHTQPNLYTLITDKPFFYWAWGYKNDNAGEKIIPHFTSKIEFLELNEVIRKSAINLANMERDNYPTRPHPRPCEKCPLASFNGGGCLDAKKWNNFNEINEEI